MMTQPKKDDIKAAKAYIRKRISAELGMTLFLDSMLLEAARKIVTLAYKRNIPPSLFSFDYDTILSHEVNTIIDTLTYNLYEEEITYATSTDRMNKDSLIGYILRDINGSSLLDRYKLYTNRFKMELEDFIIGGLALGYAASKTMGMIQKSYKNPYINPDMVEYKRKGFSSYNRLKLLSRHTIADAWMYADMEYYIMNGAKGFISYRGSSYPCDICSDMAGRFHTFAEPYPPYHPNCVCYAVPIFK